MQSKRASKAHELLPLSPTDEEILRTVSVYRYMTALDVAYRLFSAASISYVRRLLSRLCGGEDYQERQFLYRFPLPGASVGNRERVYTLGAAGRDVVESLGMPVDWYYRPSKTGRLSHSHLSHQLLVTRFVVAACRWAGQQTEYGLAEVRMSYEITRSLPKRSAEAVVPDAWLHMERDDGETFPVLVELDRGSEYQERLKNHVKGRLEFIRSGEYERVFGTPGVTIAYATTGLIPAQADSRRKTMCAWTMEVLRELEKENWAGVFRFTSALEYTALYEQGHTLFTQPVWYRPDAPSSPVLLLGS